MILVDYSNIAIAATSVALRIGEIDTLSNGFIIGKLRNYNVQFREKFGELIICADHYSWRVDAFKHYKGQRRLAKEGPQDEVFEKMLEIRTELYNALEKFAEYRCIKVRGAEGDDIMAILAKTPGEHVIISADKDMAQLVTHNVKVWNPIKKEFVDNGYSFKRALIIGGDAGDAGDGVPNILSDDDTFMVKEKRQRSMRKNIREPIMDAISVESTIDELPNVNGITTAQIQENYKRNVMLIDLDQIPDVITEAVLLEFKSQEEKKANWTSLFVTLRTGNYVTRVNDFKVNKIAEPIIDLF